MNKKKFLSVIAILLLVFSIGLEANLAFKFNPAGAAVKTQNLTDEQQVILAVRKVKASVINILGVNKNSVATTTGDLTITVPDDEVSGSGIVLTADGLIVTNNHVVSDANLDYYVFLADGSRYPAKILTQDTYDDVAFLKIEATGLVPATLGDSDALETGQTVFAVGNSLGRYQNSVTRGVVSALGRAVDATGGQTPRIQNLIQTDTAINQGNSGGPLADMSGEVVGLNTLIDTAGYSLGFAVPVNTVKDAWEQMKTFGKVSRPYLGIQFSTIDSVYQITKKYPVDNGAVIVAVGENTPAKAAGLKANDIIVAINGQVLDANHELDTELQKYQAGSQIMVKILRGSESLDLPVILGEYK